MIIWRMEHKDTGLGPYQGLGNERIWEMWREHGGVETHPTPMGEPGMRAWQGKSAWDGVYRYACTTRMQLFEWFKGYLLDLWGAGYRPRAYIVPDGMAFIGTRQVTYLHSAATRL